MQDPTLSLIMRSWSWQPLIVAGLVLAAVGYAYAFYYFQQHRWVERLLRRGQIKAYQPWCFGAGLLVIGLALLSPIDALADLLFAMHMLQHILLMMVAPILLLWGLPSPLLRWLILETKSRRVIEWLTNPGFAYVLLNVNFLVWHIPALYEAALRQPLIHDLEHALFFYTGLFYWWRIVDPSGGWFSFWRWPPAKWVYLIIAAPPSYVLGSILWGSSTVWYNFYTQVPRLWGLTALQDQRYAGMLMWLQGWMFIMASIIVFFVWYQPEQEQG